MTMSAADDVRDWADRGSLLLVDGHRIWTLDRNLGMKGFADNYKYKANQLLQTIKTKYWDDTKRLFADTKEKTSFSQHVNTLAVLNGASIIRVHDVKEAKEVIQLMDKYKQA